MRRLRCEGDHLNRLRVDLDVPGSVPNGKPVQATLTVVNEGSEGLDLVAPTSPATTNFVVFDLLWNLVAPQPAGKVNASRQILTIGPGESEAFELQGLSYVSGTAMMRYDLGPGRYRVLAVYHPGTARLLEEAEYPIAIVSSVEVLEVLEGS